MTTDKKLKKAVRERMAKTGESYSQARMLVLAEWVGERMRIIEAESAADTEKRPAPNPEGSRAGVRD